MKRFMLAVIIIALVAGGIYLTWFSTKKPPVKGIEISGNIETTEVDISFQIPGKIVLNRFQEGDMIKKGELIAKLDDRDLSQQIKISEASRETYMTQLPQLETKIFTSSEQERFQRAQANAQMEEARLKWKSVKLGSRDEQIAQAKYALEQAMHNLKYNEKELKRAQNVYKEGAMAGQQRDANQTAYLTAMDTYRQSMENYKLLKAGPRKEDIDAAWTKIPQTEAAYELVKTQSLETKQLEQQRDIIMSQVAQVDKTIKQAKIQHSYTKIFAPISGVVLVRSKESGEVVTSGTAVITMANIERVYLKAYVAETDIGKVKLGQKVVVTTDSFPDKKYDGKIYYISSNAEFTPKNLTTKEDRVKLVYKIKIDLENKHLELKPGMIADGIIEINGR